MADYSKGVVYTIRYRNDDSLIYVGSTIQPLYKRWYKHKHCCFNDESHNYNMKLYQKIRETNDIDNWYIELHESYPCANKQELNKREGEVIRDIANLNIRIEGRTIKEYRKQNKDKMRDYQKEYHENNKDKLKDYKKEWYENNKDKRKEKDKECYEKNKDKILKKRKEKITCDCGGCYTFQNKARHLKTKKHEEYLNSL